MSNQQIKISVIVPVYNAEKTILDALESVISQDYKNIELIVVDGLSSDDSLRIIKSLSGISSIISEKDTGIYDAMNKGIKVATGDWLYFLGADDKLNDDSVFSQVFADIPSDCKLIYGNVLNRERIDSRVPALHSGKFDRGLLYKNTLHHQGTFYHKSIFETHSYDSNRSILADYELNIILYLEKVKAKYIPLAIAICRADGISKDFVKTLYKEELSIKKKHLSSFQYLIQILWVWMKYLYKNV